MNNDKTLEASHIGDVIALKIDTIRREAEAWREGIILRSFTVQHRGVSVIDIREKDRKSLLSRYTKPIAESNNFIVLAK